MPPLRGMGLIRVSTHSRPKAAGLVFIDWFGFRICFNSQPPEGGWMAVPADAADVRRFNSQPPEGGWADAEELRLWFYRFQLTAARRRLVVEVSNDECV